MKTIKVKLSDLSYCKLQAIEKVIGLSRHPIMAEAIDTQEEILLECSGTDKLSEDGKAYVDTLLEITLSKNFKNEKIIVKK
jgi:hypothetical protein